MYTYDNSLWCVRKGRTIDVLFWQRVFLGSLLCVQHQPKNQLYLSFVEDLKEYLAVSDIMRHGDSHSENIGGGGEWLDNKKSSGNIHHGVQPPRPPSPSPPKRLNSRVLQRENPEQGILLLLLSPHGVHYFFLCGHLVQNEIQTLHLPLNEKDFKNPF